MGILPQAHCAWGYKVTMVKIEQWTISRKSLFNRMSSSETTRETFILMNEDIVQQLLKDNWLMT